MVHRHVPHAWRLEFSCWDHFLCMAFAQLTFRSSLLDTVDFLMARGDLLTQLGFRAPIRRSTLAEANDRRDWQLYAALARALIRQARRLYQHEPLDTELTTAAFALESTTIDLYHNLFPWARIRTTKAAIKLHTLHRAGAFFVYLTNHLQLPALVVARLHKQAQILVLDEATSALDQKTEDNVMRAINFLNAELAILIIAHRISILNNCDSNIDPAPQGKKPPLFFRRKNSADLKN